MRIEAELQALGLTLPAPLQLPPGAALPFPWVRVHGRRVFVSGHGPQHADGSLAGPFGTVELPALVIAGALDVGATPAMSQAIAERIRGSRLVVLDDVAHLSSAERPEAFASLVTEFLGEL
jgi:pimeloyl-ACP methyl ester carboxylesterase